MPITGAEPACFEGSRRPGPVTASNLRLRPLVADDAGALAELAGDLEVARTTAWLPHPLDVRLAAEYVAMRANRDGFCLAIERLADRRLIGAVDYRPDDAAGEVGCWIGKPFWRRGYAVEAVRRLARLVFETGNPDRITASVMAANPASGGMLEKAGFRLEGHGSGCGGRCKDVAVRRYALSRTDWQTGWAARPMVLVAAVAMVDADGRVLLARRPEGRSMAGLWEFPGGKVGMGETPEAALVRELHEELAVTVGEGCLAPFGFASHPYEDFHLLMPLYVCRVWRGQPLPREGQALTWIRPIRLGELPMPPADLPLVPLLRDLLGTVDTQARLYY